MEIEHRAGRLHGNADGLSRLPCVQCGSFDDWEEVNALEEHARVIQDEVIATGIDESKVLVAIQNGCRNIKLVKGWMGGGQTTVI
jgi:hypothetical protein